MTGPGRGPGRAPAPDELVRLLAPLLAAPDGSVVACDYDGTLAPIVADPDLAVPAPGAVRALTALASSVGRLAVVTGRPADVAVRLGGLASVPGLVVLGLYGAQRWESGRLSGGGPPPALGPALAEVRALLSGTAADPDLAGAWIEDKGGSFAVHLRRASAPARALARLREPVQAVADRAGLLVEPGRLVLEIRAPGSDKGGALRALVEELVADLGRAPSGVLYAGDDLGDRAAFAQVRALRSEGVPAWAVAAGSSETPEVASEADLVVDGPDGVVRLLTLVDDAIRGRTL